MKSMAKYSPGDHVKIEVTHRASGNCDDEAQMVFGKLDNEPVVNKDMWLGQDLAVSFDKIREHRKF